MVTPPPKDGAFNADVMAAAYLAGVDTVYLCGGAQAVAALAYGTESIPKVDKIVGPGNIYVATAKRLLYGTVDIDMVAGPSEILILADETADPAYLAADLLCVVVGDAVARGGVSEAVGYTGQEEHTLREAGLAVAAVAQQCDVADVFCCVAHVWVHSFLYLKRNVFPKINHLII